MILIDNFSQVMAQIETERGISRSILIEAISDALISACRRKFSTVDNLRAEVDELSGETRVFATKEVVKKVEEVDTQIALTVAKEYDDSFVVGDLLEIDVTPSNFGRIAAQTAKQVIVQRLREAEKNSIFGEFYKKEGQIITATVQKLERRNLLLNLGRIESILAYNEQIPGETYRPKDRIKVFIVEARKTSKGPQIVTSRAHPGMLKRLFEIEIPEIQDGVIEVMNVSRDPGSRSKVAVKSNNPDVGAVGTCVGKMGSRIQSIIREINNEKIDIVEWDASPEVYIPNALKPAKIARIKIISLEDKIAEVVVADDQLSLAIGKGGQNVRLAVQLTGWKIDIFKLSDIREAEEQHIQAQEEILKADLASKKSEQDSEEVAEELIAEDTATPAKKKKKKKEELTV